MIKNTLARHLFTQKLDISITMNRVLYQFGLSVFLFILLTCLTLSSPYAKANQVESTQDKQSESISEKYANADFKTLYHDARVNFLSHPKVYLEIIALMNARKDSYSPLEKQKLKYAEAFSHYIEGNKHLIIRDMEALYPELLTDKMKYRVALLIVNAAASAQVYDLAMYYLNELEKVLPKVKDKVSVRTYYVQAMSLYKNLKQHDLVLEHVKAYLSLPELSEDALCETYHYQIEALYSQGKLKSDSPEITQAISYCVPQKNLKLMQSYSIKIDLLLAEEKTESALQLIEATDTSNSPNAFKTVKAAYQLHYAQAFLQQGYFDKAIESAKASLALYQGNSEPRVLSKIYHILHAAYWQKNDMENALENYIRYTEEEQLILNENAERLLAFQLAKLKITEKINEIEALNNQNTLLRLEQQLTKENERSNHLIIALLLLLVLFLVLWMYRSLQIQKQLQEIARVDRLTRVASRGYFTEVANKLLFNSQRDNTPLSLLLFDLDNFKLINDVYGYSIGDWVLRETSKACKNSIRKGDIIGRLGGEEFGVLLPNCDREQAVRIAEKCRKALLALDTEETEFKFEVSGSFGVSDVTESGYIFKDILHHCDEALYEAKHRGRNQVVEYPFNAKKSEEH